MAIRIWMTVVQWIVKLFPALLKLWQNINNLNIIFIPKRNNLLLRIYGKFGLVDPPKIVAQITAELKFIGKYHYRKSYISFFQKLVHFNKS